MKYAKTDEERCECLLHIEKGYSQLVYYCY